MAIEAAQSHPMFIDGEHVEASSGEWLEVHSPATGELVGRVPAGTEADVDRAVAAARRVFRAGTWSRTLLSDRTAVLDRLADLIEANADELARLETLQTGTAYKLRRESDLPFTVDNLRFFATAVRHLEGKPVRQDAARPDQGERSIMNGLSVQFTSRHTISGESQHGGCEMHRVLKVSGLRLEVVRPQVHPLRPNNSSEVSHD